MRIVVDDIAASKTGALSVLRDFYNYIAENEAAGNEWIFVLGDRLLEERDNIRIIVRDDVKASRKNRLKFDLMTGAAFFEGLKPDVLFSMQNTLPRGYGGRQVLYVHQPLGYQNRKRFSLLKAEEREYAVYQKLIGRMIDASVKRADKVIVQTEWMRKAVAGKTGISGDRIVKIMPDIKVPEEFIRQPAGIDGSCSRVNTFFYPAGEILYKNHGCILEAVGMLKSKDISDFTVEFTLNRGDLPYLDRYPGHEQVRYLGRISREEVFERYKKDILLFPSYIETFGYPPAEARAVGGRILASDCPFCHEVLEGYSLSEYFDPFKPAELAALMEKAICGELFNGEAGGIHAAGDQSCNNTGTGSRCSWAEVTDVILDR
jgi:glycosyltransferase involved in cell wall biosynthesis